jgi:hypothetical protein
MEDPLLSFDDPTLFARVAGGYDPERGAFVAISEVPDLPLRREGSTTYRGNIVLCGPAPFPKDGRYRMTPKLAERLASPEA